MLNWLRKLFAPTPPEAENTTFSLPEPEVDGLIDTRKPWQYGGRYWFPPFDKKVTWEDEDAHEQKLVALMMEIGELENENLKLKAEISELELNEVDLVYYKEQKERDELQLREEKADLDRHIEQTARIRTATLRDALGKAQARLRNAKSGI